MTIETLLATIQGLLALGFAVGLLVGVTVPRPVFGLPILLTVPIAMAGYVGWWQSQHPEHVGPNSALDFLYGPLWPSLGAVGGYLTGMLIRSILRRLS